MNTFYFTYGSDHHYIGGWTEVEANTYEAAIDLFNIVHPKINGYVNCSMIYSKKDFINTKMYTEGNFGFKCVERISYNHDILDRAAINTNKEN